MLSQRAPQPFTFKTVDRSNSVHELSVQFKLGRLRIMITANPLSSESARLYIVRSIC